MCFNPIHLKLKGTNSPNRLSDDGEISSCHDAYGVDVPCGHCEQCLNSKKDGYLLRCLSEFDRSANVFFITLTYNNKNLPFIKQYSSPVFDEDGSFLVPPKCYKRSVWDKTHVQKFFKSLNESCIYYYGTQVLGIQRLKVINGRRRITDEWKDFLSKIERPLKYLLVCERGKNNIYLDDSGKHRRGSRRPHYHVQLFSRYSEIPASFILDKIKEFWTYGYSYNILLESNDKKKVNKYSRDLVQSTMYVCKYVVKDLQDVSHKLLYNDHDTQLRHAPFLLTSYGLGDNMLENYSEDELFQKLMNGITVPGTEYTNERNVPIPRYNQLKSRMYVRVKGDTYISSRIPDTEVLSDGYHPIFLDHLHDDLQHRIYIKYNTLLTDFGEKVIKSKKLDSAKEYTETLRLIRRDQKLFTSLLNHSLSVIDVKYLDDILSVDIENFYTYCLNPYSDSVADLQNTYYRAMLGIRQYMVTIQKISLYRSKLEFKLKLEKSLESKPELLCLQPL